MESNKEKNFISVIVYCRNDESYIQHFIASLDKTLNDNFLKYEIIIVNDASTDSSTLMVKQYVEEVKNAGRDITVSVF